MGGGWGGSKDEEKMSAPPPPWWPPRGGREWEVAEPCVVPAPPIEDVEALLSTVPPAAWPGDEEPGGEGEGEDCLVLSGAFLRQLAVSEEARRERRREEERRKGETMAPRSTPQAALEDRRRLERSEALEDVLRLRREVREYREHLYGEEGLQAILDAEDRINEAFDDLCSRTGAPVWPTPMV